MGVALLLLVLGSPGRRAGVLPLLTVVAAGSAVEVLVDVAAALFETSAAGEAEEAAGAPLDEVDC